MPFLPWSPSIKSDYMIKHFSSIKKLASTPPPSVNFDGTWKNELTSSMTIKVVNGVVTGKYSTGVGAPQPGEEFDIVGFASGDLISFTVNFGVYGSLASWVGQHTVEGGLEVIKTMWLLTKNIPERWTPTFRPLSAEVKKDFPSLLASVFVCVVSVCASKNFREERTSRDSHCPSSLPVCCRVRVFTAAGGLTSSLCDSLAVGASRRD